MSEHPEKLTARQRRFVEEYLVDLNATRAAIRSGYAESGARTEGARLLANADITDAIAAAQEIRSKRVRITQDQVLRELAKIGFADIRKVMRWTGTASQTEVIEELEGQPHGGALKRSRAVSTIELLGSDEIDDDTAAAISEVSDTANGIRIKFHDKKGALVDIGKHLGMFVDRHEYSGPDGAPIEVVQAKSRDLSKAIALILAKGLKARTTDGGS